MEQLPQEILYHIFSCLDDPSDVAALSACCSVLHEVASDPLLWRPLLDNGWHWGNSKIATLSNSQAEEAPQQSDSISPIERFRKRKLLDRRTQKCILSMVANPHGRLKYVEAISDSFMDAVDAVRSLRLRHGRIKKNYGIDYYCRLVENHLSRKLGIHVLQKLAARSSTSTDGSDSLFALFGIGCFCESNGVDFDLVDTLEQLRSHVLGESAGRWSDLPVNATGSSDKIASIMHIMYEHGIRPADSTEYYDLRNSFVYSVMKFAQPTIPITMVAIFVALATRLGLECYAVGFPGQVLAAVKDGDKTIFVAPYEDGKRYQRAELVNRLHTYNMRETDQYLAPCSLQDLCVRSARNILNCIERGTDTHTLDGLYAALTTLRLMGSQLPLSENQFMTLVCLHYPYDIGLWGKLQIPEHQELIRQTRMEDVTVHRAKRRAEQPVEIRHRIGVMFRHAIFGYTAIITGWDHYCDQTPEWIRHMRVDMLERKTRQPFYNVLVSDGSERYVAEDNVLPITDNETPVFHSIESLPIVGKYFESSVDQKFLPSSDLLQAYPDDF